MLDGVGRRYFGYESGPSRFRTYGRYTFTLAASNRQQSPAHRHVPRGSLRVHVHCSGAPLNERSLKRTRALFPGLCSVHGGGGFAVTRFKSTRPVGAGGQPCGGALAAPRRRDRGEPPKSGCLLRLVGGRSVRTGFDLITLQTQGPRRNSRRGRFGEESDHFCFLNSTFRNFIPPTSPLAFKRNTISGSPIKSCRAVNVSK
jgi:hypothetical protein